MDYDPEWADALFAIMREARSGPQASSARDIDDALNDALAGAQEPFGESRIRSIFVTLAEVLGDDAAERIIMGGIASSIENSRQQLAESAMTRI